ncbi:acyl-CoA thioesterase [uncultured Sphingomonas sp.]|uniref:acyl-CoA thioesterase n=1 Tax=uncultured Sphingomonas sp. TaxID=158754 RepID=UPI0035C971FA
MSDESPHPIDLVELLDVERIDTDLYRGARQPLAHGRVYGGQVIAQALQAAQRSTDGKDAHSLHAYFMRPGDDALPIIFRVVRDFDGRSFATRRVIATQNGQPILNMAASFQPFEEGLHHQDAMPADLPGPEDLPSESEVRARMSPVTPEAHQARLRSSSGIDFRTVEPDGLSEAPRDPVNHCWFKTMKPLADDPALHRAILAYASDMGLMATAMNPHGIRFFTHGFKGASLDHALWLHEPFRADEWLLYAMDSPWSGHGRGINRGRIFTRDGRLVASVAQEGLMRPVRPRK